MDKEKTKLVLIRNLQIGQGINYHPYGYMQFMGLVKKSFSNDPIEPHAFRFNRGVDKYGKLRNDVILTNGDKFVQLIDE